MSTRIIELNISEDFGRRLKDPANEKAFHYETFLPFTEAIKLQRGNANVRPPKKNHPFKSMMETVEQSPDIFHLKNRGITYICNKFVYDNQQKRLSITVPNIPVSKLEDTGAPRFGIADGGHTFKVIEDVIQDIETYKNDGDWIEPYVRVHFMAGDVDVEEVVEALNTSSQVKNYTLDDYNNRFERLKTALKADNFDPDMVAWRENEEEDWQVMEIIQRLACFLKERWKIIPPSSLYRSKGDALQLYINSGEEFEKLFDVIKDVVTLPEYIQSALPENIKAGKIGNVKGVKKQNKSFRREGTSDLSHYKMDGGIVLPMASAFRSLLVLKGDRYQWKVDPRKVFEHCADDLYKVLLLHIKRVKNASQLGADQEYWINCEKIVLNAKEEMEG